MTRVLVAAASIIVRAGLETLMTSSPALTVVGSTSGGAGLAKQIEALQPDVVLMEWSVFEDEPVLETLLPLSDVYSQNWAFVILADDPSGTGIAEALRSGVRALLPREATSEEIVAAVEAAAAGLVVLHPDIIDFLLPVLPSTARTLPTLPSQSLTAREIEVLGMLAEGLGNKAIARRLSISEHTVKFHVSSIFTKLNASSRTEAVTLGARLGLIML